MNAALYLNDYKSVDSSLSVGDHTRLKHMINDALSTISLQTTTVSTWRALAMQ